MKLTKESYKISISTPMIAALTGFSLGVFALHYFGKKGVLLGFSWPRVWGGSLSR